MNFKKVRQLLFFCLVFFFTKLVFAITVNGTGSTFIINKGDGFDGADGADREAVFVAAAQFWADRVVSSVDIVIDAEFSSTLFCSSNSATLGSAGPLSSYFSTGAESHGLLNNVWYPSALINASTGYDYIANSPDITATFNDDLGDADCLSASGWYYGIDGNVPSGQTGLYGVILHEFAHGLGFLSLVDDSGQDNNNRIDIYTTFLHDQSTDKSWSDMNSSERVNSNVNAGQLVWLGSEVNALSSSLSSGINAGKVRMYAPSPYISGSSISHFDSALTPNVLMEPQYKANADTDFAIALLKDIGWSVAGSSNNVPVITGQTSLSVNEDTSLTLILNHLTVTDADNNFPADFSLTVNSGNNYTVVNNTITPNSHFSGTLTVPVRVNDGVNNSSNFNLFVTVNPVNDKPLITGQNTLSINEDSNLLITSSLLNITDPDDNAFTVVISPGNNYSVEGTTITPALNFNGVLSVPIKVNDGEADSDNFTVTITVNAINDIPVITGQKSLNILENASYTITSADINVNDVDSNIVNVVVQNGANYSFSGNTITPVANFNGVLLVPITVNDGLSSSLTYNLTINVNAVNAIPEITGQTLITIDEDKAVLITTDLLTIVDSDNSDFSLTIANGSEYTLNDNLLTPAEHFNGTLSVFISVNDGVNESNTYNLMITVTPVNDAPVLAGMPENITSQGNEYSVQFSTSDVDSISFEYSVVSQDNWLSINENGLLTGVPVNTIIGEQSITVSVSDGDKSDSINFVVNVTENNVDNISVILQADQQLIAPNESTTIQLIVRNEGDQLSSGSVSFVFDEASAVSDVDPRCNLIETTEYVCTYTNLLTVTEFNFTVKSIEERASVFVSELVITENDNITDDNTAAITLFYANTIEALTTELEFVTPADSNAITITDVNNNNLTNILVANSSTINQPIFELSSDNNTINEIDTLVVSGNAKDVIVVDLNNDNIKDIVYATGGANYVFFANAEGEYGQPVLLGSSNSLAVVATDFSGDGFVDLAFANEGVNHLYINDQMNGFMPEQSFGSATSASSDLVIFDYNNDGWQDIIVSNTNEKDVIYINNQLNPSVLFDSSAIIVSDIKTSSTVLSLINLSGADDSLSLIVGHSLDKTVTNASGVSLYLFEAGVFVLHQVLQTGSVVSLTTGDYNGDSLTDLVVLNADDVVQIYLQSAQTNQLALTQSFELENSQQVLLQHIDNDNKADLLLLRSGTSPSQLVLSSKSALEGSTTPVISGQSVLSMDEDTQRVLETSSLLINDSDSNTFTLSILPGSNYSVVQNLNQIIPALHFNGLLTIPVVVSDGVNQSNIFNVLLTVNAVNDAPFINQQNVLNVNQNETLALNSSHFSITDVDDSEFTLLIEGGDNYQVSNGQIVPDNDFIGTLNVGIRANDGVASSERFNAIVNVIALGEQGTESEEDSGGSISFFIGLLSILVLYNRKCFWVK